MAKQSSVAELFTQAQPNASGASVGNSYEIQRIRGGFKDGNGQLDQAKWEPVLTALMEAYPDLRPDTATVAKSAWCKRENCPSMVFKLGIKGDGGSIVGYHTGEVHYSNIAPLATLAS